jgi:predicted nucleic acid-binding Zn ribbon protein
MKKVGTLLSSIFKDLGIEDKIRLNSMQEEWHKLFNEPLSLHTHPVDIKDGELTINVDSPAWLGQLKFFKHDIIKRLQAYNVSSVKFKHGRVYQKKGQGARGKWQEDSKHLPKSFTDSEFAWINQTVSKVSDPELQENIRKAIEKAMSR